MNTETMCVCISEVFTCGRNVLSDVAIQKPGVLNLILFMNKDISRNVSTLTDLHKLHLDYQIFFLF